MIIVLIGPMGCGKTTIGRLLADKLGYYFDDADTFHDGGNSNYHDTIRRAEAIEARGLRFIGTGVSGGEEGALKGPSVFARCLSAQKETRVFASTLLSGPAPNFFGDWEQKPLPGLSGPSTAPRSSLTPRDIR